MSISYAEAAALRKAAQQSAKPRRVSQLRASAATAGAELPHSHSHSHSHPQLGTNQPEPMSFQRVARPGAYYERPRIKRDLPSVSSPWMGIAAFGLVGIAGWGTFLAYSTNQERLSSSVVRQILQNLRESPLVRELLGDGVRPEPTWYLNGDPWIHGSINVLQGNVDISMRVKGSKQGGTLYFTSVRQEKGQPFQVVRFKIICDDKSVINLPTGLSRQ